MRLSSRTSARPIFALYDVAGQAIPGMDAQNVPVDAIPMAVGRGTVPGGRAKAVGSDDANLIPKVSQRHCFL